MDRKMKQLGIKEIAQMIDISAVKTDSSDQKIMEMINVAQKYGCYLVTVLPAQTKMTKDFLRKINAPLKIGGNVGFPSGGETTSTKVNTVKELITIGVDEIDMVINVAALLSGRKEDVYHDIVAVVEAAEGRPIKLILECHYLSDDEIRAGCDLAIKAGADYVKTGTGWAPTGATTANISLIKKHVGDAIKIKASGGIRGVKNLLELYKHGAERFGISTSAVVDIFEEYKKMSQPIELEKEREMTS